METDALRNLETDKGLLVRLSDAVSVPVSRDEIERQGISFVYGCLDYQNPLSREDIGRILEKQKLYLN